MEFHFTIFNLINALIIAGGIGICVLCMLQISGSIHIRKEVRHYFLVFFSIIILYIFSHLIREVFNGVTKTGVRETLFIITFIETLSACFLVHIMSLLLIAVLKLPKKSVTALVVLMYIFLIAHIVTLIVGWPLDFIYYFDSVNLYHRGPGYLLSNLSPVLIMIIDVILLIKYRKNIDKKINIAFWNYIIAPIIAIIIQSFSSSIQYIIVATIGSSVYMFFVIIRHQNELYQRQQIESSRISTELTMASAIQADMVPNLFPAFPEREEFDVYATMTPAKQVGGDFYDFFLIDDDHLCLVMADVSGKGVAAALFMMASKIILANNAMMGKKPAQILSDTNATICANNREEMFVTVWLGILEISTGKLTAANAGHEYPVIKKDDGKFELFKDPHGFVIGGIDCAKYVEYEIQLTPGSKLFLYTDGVPEAINSKKVFFGNERMVDSLNKYMDLTPTEILKNVKSDVEQFAQEAEQFDDITMLAFEYKGIKKTIDT